jgi:hypothetical protein
VSPGGWEEENDKVTLKLTDLTKKENFLLKSNESPFSMIGSQIGTSIKNIFGGFGNLFKKEERGRQGNEQIIGMRSRSIQSMHTKQ